MNFLEKFDISGKVLKAIILRHTYPLIVRWDLTYKCNSRCSYCSYWKVEMKELDTKGAFCLIEGFASSGTKFIVFSGGEPLLRDDLPDIINFCKQKKIHISINSNGTLIRQRIKEIRKADAIKLSLDAPRQVNDRLRGKGAHDTALEAIKVCNDEGIAVNITTVISRYNISHIPYVLNIAKEFNIRVSFQPVKQERFDEEEASVTATMPNVNDYKSAVLFLIKEKRNGNKFIKNSVAGLKHLYHWPKQKKLFCFMSFFSCYANPNGYIYACDWVPHSRKHFISPNTDLKKVYQNLQSAHSCKYCWTASMVDFNLLGGGEFASIREMWRRLNA